MDLNYHAVVGAEDRGEKVGGRESRGWQLHRTGQSQRVGPPQQWQHIAVILTRRTKKETRVRLSEHCCQVAAKVLPVPPV